MSQMAMATTKFPDGMPHPRNEASAHAHASPETCSAEGRTDAVLRKAAMAKQEEEKNPRHDFMKDVALAMTELMLVLLILGAYELRTRPQLCDVKDLGVHFKCLTKVEKLEVQHALTFNHIFICCLQHVSFRIQILCLAVAER